MLQNQPAPKLSDLTQFTAKSRLWELTGVNRAVPAARGRPGLTSMGGFFTSMSGGGRDGRSIGGSCWASLSCGLCTCLAWASSWRGGPRIVRCLLWQLVFPQSKCCKRPEAAQPLASSGGAWNWPSATHPCLSQPSQATFALESIEERAPPETTKQKSSRGDR